MTNLSEARIAVAVATTAFAVPVAQTQQATTAVVRGPAPHRRTTKAKLLPGKRTLSFSRCTMVSAGYSEKSNHSDSAYILAAAEACDVYGRPTNVTKQLVIFRRRLQSVFFKQHRFAVFAMWARNP